MATAVMAVLTACQDGLQIELGPRHMIERLS